MHTHCSVTMPISHVHVHANSQPLDRRPYFYSFPSPPWRLMPMHGLKGKGDGKICCVPSFRKRLRCFASGYLRPLGEFHATIIGSNGNFPLLRVQAVRGSRLGTGLRFHQLLPCLPLSNRQKTRCNGVRVRHKRLGFTCISPSPALPAGISSVRFTHWSSRRQVYHR